MKSAQHEKTWLFDHSLIFVGIANASGNSMFKCCEAGVISKSEVLIEQHAAHFGTLWETSTPANWPALRKRKAASREKKRSGLLRVCGVGRRPQAQKSQEAGMMGQLEVADNAPLGTC